MKQLLILLNFILASVITTQAQSGTTAYAKLYLPVHLKSTILPTDKLVIHFVSENDTLKNYISKVTAKKDKDNEYSFTLPVAMHYRVVFAIGNYSYNISCVDNRQGDANNGFAFEVLLEKEKFNPASLKFIAPCIIQEDDYQ